MRRLAHGFLTLSFIWLVGCGGPKTVENLKPLTDEEKAKIAKETQQTEDEESPNNKTRKDKKKKS